MKDFSPEALCKEVLRTTVLKPKTNKFPQNVLHLFHANVGDRKEGGKRLNNLTADVYAVIAAMDDGL